MGARYIINKTKDQWHARDLYFGPIGPNFETIEDAEKWLTEEYIPSLTIYDRVYDDQGRIILTGTIDQGALNG